MPTATTFEVKTQKLFIDGEWKDPLTQESYPTINPATEESVCNIAKGGPKDVDAAVRAARNAFDGGEWSKLEAKDREKILWRIGDLIDEHADELAYLETVDMGKPIRESRNVDVPFVADVFRYYAGWATKLHGDTVPGRGGHFAFTLREPVGVVGAITPWNFPLLLTAWKVAPALAMGCSVVHKPATATPLTALKLAEICREAGLPKGAHNVVTGPGGAVGDALVTHPGVDKIAFTGSTSVGVGVMQKAAPSVKRVSMELGGKSPLVVFADADLKAAAAGAMVAIFYNKGEVCAAGSRLFVERKVHDQMVELLVERAKKLNIGDPLDPNTRMGPVAMKSQQDSVLGYVEKGKAEGAKVATGGKADKVNGKGYFVHPTIMTGATNEMTIAREEIFGPVLTVIPFDGFDEGLKLANETIYGLASGVYTNDIGKAHKFARGLKAGTVWVNMYNLYDPGVPFGGYKQSGFGRELGEAGLEGYTQTKSVWINLPK
ncbi:MAG TPA: aldehyde dehydrogenase family protein [Planctomycetota bacterium]|jgi:acyl-CoA reductase-like NAD-dependent aldehyde dehydrogenase|nr:aldehyde dehydrogenase family protein [Planctomycetota bacterium]